MSEFSSDSNASRGRHKSVRCAGTRWLAAVATVVFGLKVVLGSCVSPLNPHLARYVYGDPPAIPDNVHQLADRTVLDLGYMLVLTGCACIFLLGAASKPGRKLAQYVAAAALIALAADLVEDEVAYRLIAHSPATLAAVVGAAITIKWCASLVALVGIPAAAGILLRFVGAWISRARSTHWQTSALAEPPPGSAPEGQSTMFNAYWVPNAQAVIDRSGSGKPQALCLSGGGVRSACVAMGAMQEFSKFPAESDPKLIDALDYVISVSGGGFSAAARLLAVQSSDDADPDPDATEDKDDRGHTTQNGAHLISERFGEGSPEFDYLRRHSSYIADTPAQLVWALAVLLKNLLASLSVLFLLPVLLGWAVGYLLSRPDFSFAVLVPVPSHDADFEKKHPRDYLLCLIDHHGSWLAVAFFACCAVIFTAAAIVVEVFRWRKRSEQVKLGLQRAAAASAVFALLVLTVAAGIPALMRLCEWVFQHAAENRGVAAAAASGVVGLNYLAAIAAVAWKDRGALARTEITKLSWWRRTVPPGVLPIILVTATLALLAFAWVVTLGSVAAGVFEALTSGGAEGTHPRPSAWLLAAGAALAVISVLDVTSLSLHPYYRHRLGRAFAVRRVTKSGRESAAPYADNEYTWLIKHGRVHAVTPGTTSPSEPAGGPAFIFAAAAALSGDGRPAPGLNAVSFVLSSDHIGGPELGYWNTRELFKHAPPRIKRDLTVITAVAVSGAAFASAMGRYQKGFEKLLAVSGARLGTWLPNPNFYASRGSSGPQNAAKSWPRSLPRIRGAGYFYRELLGLNYKDARLVQVTDGGHYDNLGLVEALRRRCRFIICIDGGGDTPPLLSGLAESVRLATYELGALVKFDGSHDYLLADVAPGSGNSRGARDIFSGLQPRLAKRTVASAVITYPKIPGLLDDEDQRTGLLIYAKAVLCEACPPWLLTYAAAHPEFPHDPTFDQWFNEGQFAAYTELGRIMGRQVQDCLRENKPALASEWAHV